MKFDILTLTDSEISKLSVTKIKLLRAAQLKKDALVHKAESEYKKFEMLMQSQGLKNSTLLADKRAELDADVEYHRAIIRDNLIYSMSVAKESANGGNGSGNGSGGAVSPGYLVDYSLSYNQRYVIVRDYYLAIADVEERMARYSADTVAMDYLSSYYNTLYNVLGTYGN